MIFQRRRGVRIMPIIGISGSILIDQGGIFPGYRRAYVNDDYVQAVIQAGGTPVILPVIGDLDLIREVVATLDGLILSGGHDVTTQLYGEEPRQKLGDTYPERDLFDMKLIEFAMARNIPILGICRGFQILNVYHGGSLYQDLSYADKELLKHVQGTRPELETHEVDLVEDSILFNLLNEKKVRVNSFHHQVVKSLGNSLVKTAVASDGVIEAFEHQSYPWLVGVQFHPEMMHRGHLLSKEIFKSFVTHSHKGK